jgi:hypothetical protein
VEFGPLLSSNPSSSRRRRGRQDSRLFEDNYGPYSVPQVPRLAEPHELGADGPSYPHCLGPSASQKMSGPGRRTLTAVLNPGRRAVRLCSWIPRASSGAGTDLHRIGCSGPHVRAPPCSDVLHTECGRPELPFCCCPSADPALGMVPRIPRRKPQTINGGGLLRGLRIKTPPGP